MIIKLKPNPDKEQLSRLIAWLERQGVDVRPTVGENIIILGLVGDTTKIDSSLIQALEIVEDIKRIQEPYKEANRRFHPEDTIITLENGTKIGGDNFTLIAGPCSVESEEQIIEVARAVKKSGAKISLCVPRNGRKRD